MSDDRSPNPGTLDLPPRLVRDLYDNHIPPAAITALGLYPLIHVAWADGRIQAAERELVEREVGSAGLPVPAQKLVQIWLRRPPSNPNSLLDLAWQLVERLPAPLQRMAAQDAGRQARTVAMAAGPAAEPVEPSEEAALAQVVAALGGRGAETARREALLFGLEVEDQLPGYQVYGPSLQLPPGEALRDEDFDGALDTLVRPGLRYRKVMWRPPSSRQRLFDLVARAHRRSTPEELSDLGLAGRLDELDAWQVCRFVIWLVCRGATYDPAYREAVSETEVGSPEDRSSRPRRTRDHVSSLVLLRHVLDFGDLPLICRDYVRLVVELYQACRGNLPACHQTRLIPVSGAHDLRSAGAHAWCVFLDSERRLAVPLDPTAADALWDARWARGPFNDLLDGRGLCTASAILTRLLEEPSLAAFRACQAMVAGLPTEMRPWLVLRCLVQDMTEVDLDYSELRLMLHAAQVAGAPQGLTDWILKRRSDFDAMGGHHLEDPEEPRRRGRLAELFCQVGLMAQADLPRRLAENLAEHRAWVRTRQAQRDGVGRNDPCPCGSGKKYKKCCGRRA